MMATTHALAGAALATVMLFVAPEFSTVAVVAGLVGGIFPDMDLYTEHRKTLHFPVYYSVLAVTGAAVAFVTPTPATVAVAFFLLGAALHSVMDIFGGGLELKPWHGTSDRAVYNHFFRRWHRPRRWIHYDGAPSDFALGLVLAAPTLLFYEGVVQEVVVAALGVSFVYAALRKRLVHFAEWLIENLPQSVLPYVPERFLADFT